MLDCPIKQNIGIPCPGCGLQRSLLEIWHGNFIESLKLYPVALPLVFLFVYLLFHLKFKYANGARNLVILFVFNITLIYGSFILSLFDIWFCRK